MFFDGMLQFNPDSLVLYLNGSASSSVYEELLNSVTYINRQLLCK